MGTVIHIITGLNDGGAEAVLYRLATFDASQEQVVVSLADTGKYGALLEGAGITVHCLDMPRGLLTLRGIWRLWRILGDAQQPKIVQTWMYHANLVGGLIAWLKGHRAIFWGIHHTNLVAGATGPSTRIVDRLCAMLSSLVPQGIVACAERAKEVHVANGYAARKFTVIPNGYDVNRFAPDEAAGAEVRRELEISGGGPVIGMVGRWDPHKDHANLIAAASVLRENWPDLQLVLAGTNCDPDNNALSQLLLQAGILRNTHLLGQRKDIPAVMNALDLHVLSSRGEAFPNVVAEAMACGTPCVVTDVGDAAVIVGDTGLVVPPRDSEALADAIMQLLSERGSQAWAARREAARRRISEHFSIERMVNSYRAIWFCHDGHK